MRPVRIIATAAIFVLAIAVTGCSSRSADQTAAPPSPCPAALLNSHYPGRKDTFQAKGRQSGTAASATFTVTG